MTQKEKIGVQIEVYSDVICPWCYVGEARLNQAIQSISADFNVAAVWQPFELNPTMPEGGMDRKEYLTRKFGHSDMSGMQEKLNAAGAADGLRFNFAAMKRVPNTFNAHRLLWFAKSNGLQGALADILFRRYFTETEDIGDLEVLVAAASEAGIVEDDARQFLESEAGSAEVRKEQAAGLALGIHAVPTFVMDGRVIASGAIAPTALAQLIQEGAEARLAKS